ncbi:FAS1 domain-containing protein, partial [Rhizodiscina lignyota]
MKLLAITSLLALSNAFVLPDEQVFSGLAVEDDRESKSAWDKLPSVKDLLNKVSHGVEDAFDGVADKAENIIDHILDAASETESYIVDEAYETAFDVQGWLESGNDAPCEASFEDPEHSPPHGPPHGPPYGPPHGPPPPHDGPPHHGPPHHGPPHHGPPHHGHSRKSNLTIYEMIANSKYTTKLAKLIGEHEDLVQLLNGTSGNFTFFAPTDAAFKKIPKHAPKPGKEFLEKLLTYHVSESLYPGRRLFASDTIPSAYNESALGGPQRLAVKLGLKGLTINFYSRIVAANIFATNGVIHGVDSILLPPPPIGVILDLLPEEFSTLLLAFIKTNLGAELYNYTHVGGTVFAPNNFAFKKLGPGPNAFLFSRPGLKYLKALLKYHLVANVTLYSDTVYGAKNSGDLFDGEEVEAMQPRRAVHVDLPTLLGDRSLPVDIFRFGPFISMKVNGFVRIAVKDGIAKDGVIHVPSDVLIPPKKLRSAEEVDEYQGGEISVDDLKERLDPFV